MSAYERKYAAAMDELATTDMWPSSYAPPLHKLYRRIGLEVRPPHYANFKVAALDQGTFFTVVWGVLMWLTQWHHVDGMPIKDMMFSALVAGTLFGLAMAFGYWYSRRKWKLTAWHAL